MSSKYIVQTTQIVVRKTRVWRVCTRKREGTNDLESKSALFKACSEPTA